MVGASRYGLESLRGEVMKLKTRILAVIGEGPESERSA